jgi:hypothetical protein
VILSSAPIPEWVLFASLALVGACVIGGMIRFVQAIKILLKGAPSIDEDLILEQERESNSQDDE